VDAAQLRSNMDDLRRDRGKFCPDAWLNARLLDSDPPRLKMQSRRPADGLQNASARDLECGTDVRGQGFDLLTPLLTVQKALARCEHDVRLRASKKYFFVSGPVNDAPLVERTVMIPAAPVICQDRLAWQVRQLRHPKRRWKCG
jgi:hypothetical protein